MNEISRTARAQPPARTRGTRRIQTNRDHIQQLNTGPTNGDPQSIRNLLQANVRALLRQRGMLAKPLDQEPLILIQ
jgi:hypothetical protein